MFPFLFYGSLPRDWFEGANLGHFYELRFTSPPTPEQKLAIAAVWGRKTAAGSVEPGPWRWADGWALVVVGERHISQHDAFFARMQELMRAVHAVAPLAEVIFWGARGETDNDWERNTLGQQRVPTAGPAWPGMVPQSWYHQARDPALPTGASDPDFASAVSAAAEEDDPADHVETPITVDDRPSTDLDDAVARAEKVLNDFMIGDDYYDGDVQRIWMFYCAKDSDQNAVDISFGCADPEDADLRELAERAIAALHESLPQLGFPVQWELSE